MGEPVAEGAEACVGSSSDEDAERLLSFVTIAQDCLPQLFCARATVANESDC